MHKLISLGGARYNIIIFFSQNVNLLVLLKMLIEKKN